MKTVFRIILIILFALVVGIIINQLQPGGISWRSLLYPALFKAGVLKSDIMVVSADSAMALLHNGSAVFVDVRTEEDYQLDHIPGAENIPSGIIIKGRFSTLGNYNNETFILYDEEGDLEQLELLSAIWSSQRVKKTYILFGGYLSWLQNQYPVEFDG
jgi:rhodanese-related sulfurtransferase